LGAALLQPLAGFHNLFTSILGLSAIAYSLHELGIFSLPHPQRKKQVPSYWRWQFHPYITAGLFGLLLGAGFVTFIPVSTYYILALLVWLSGSPLVGMLVFSIFGASRASLLWLFSSRVANTEMVITFTDYMDLTKVIVRQVNGFALAVAGAYLVTGFTHGLFW
jgi:hypothetical protein